MSCRPGRQQSTLHLPGRAGPETAIAEPEHLSAGLLLHRVHERRDTRILVDVPEQLEGLVRLSRVQIRKQEPGPRIPRSPPESAGAADVPLASA